MFATMAWWRSRSKIAPRRPGRPSRGWTSPDYGVTVLGPPHRRIHHILHRRDRARATVEPLPPTRRRHRRRPFGAREDARPRVRRDFDVIVRHHLLDVGRAESEFDATTLTPVRHGSTSSTGGCRT